MKKFERRTVAVILFDEVNAIDVTGPLEAFACARTNANQPAYEIMSWALDDLAVKTESGLKLCADRTLPTQPTADILIIPGGKGIRTKNTISTLSSWLQQHHQKFRCISSVCTGAYALAEAGLLNGRHVTTHWAHAKNLQDQYPDICVRSDSLFLQDGRFYSSGGVTAGIDLALDLIENDLGSNAAMHVARELVVFLRRTGTQAQFSIPLQFQTAASDKLGEVCKWAAGHLEEDLSVDVLARRAGLSTRQFSRKFRAAFDLPPATYIKRVRLDAGRALLDQGVSLSRAAHASGFRSDDGFRRAFENEFGVSPRDYQKRFLQEEAPK